MTAKTKTSKSLNSGKGKNTELREEFARWLIDPFREGTQQAWAAEHGISEETVSTWRKHPDVVAILKEWRTPFEADFALVMRRLFRVAMTGSNAEMVPAVRLLADTMGQIAPKKMDITGKGLIEWLGSAES